MKKRAMKKYIPKDTIYCNECKYLHHITTIILNETNCEYAKDCEHKPCWSKPNNSCRTIVYRCDYLNYTDWEQESLLWDGCKECGEHEDY